MKGLVYLDHAATSAVRPPAVARAITDYLSGIGATPGRGGHRLAVQAGRLALHCRQQVAQLLRIPGDTGRIAFMAGATHALNTALHGTLRTGDRLVVTVFDHNSVLRPAAALARDRGVDVVLIDGDASGALDEHALSRALDGARVFAINAASNVLGTRLDVPRLTALARDAGALSLVDAAQSAGHVPADEDAGGADMIAFAGHKGMLGPQGIGGLWAREGIAVAPLITGGTGGDSLERDMPASFPDHLEAGTTNGPGIAGLAAGIGVVLDDGVAAIHHRTALLRQRLHDGLSATEGVRVLTPAVHDGVPIVTIVAADVDPATLAARLDREHGVLTRPGLHCAPEVHRLLGTAGSGAVRFSLGRESVAADVDRAIAAVHAVLHGPAIVTASG